MCERPAIRWPSIRFLRPRYPDAPVLRRPGLWSVLVAVAVTGCAPMQHTAEPAVDEFFEEWRQMALSSQGFSPAIEDVDVDITDVFERLDEDVDRVAVPERPLPKTRVTLQFRDVDIRVVIRALSRAAGQNIIMSNDVQGTISVNIEDMPWDQVFRSIIATHSLSFTWEHDILRIMSLNDMNRDVQIDRARNARLEALADARRLEPLQTSVARVRYADAADLRDNLTGFLGVNEGGETRGSVAVDKHNNALIIQASAADTERLLRLLRNLDRPRAQVLLRAYIVETSRDTARDLGIQWGGRFVSQRLGRADDRLFIGDRPGQERVPNPATIIGDPRGAGSALTLPLLYGRLDGNLLEAQLTALQTQRKLNILSSPSITTMDNQMAFTESGRRVPFVVRDSDGEQTVEFQEAVLRLEITPNVIDGVQLRMGVKVKKDEVDTETPGVQGNPLIIRKQTETNLIVAHGETIVISGLSKETSQGAKSGVPGLMNVPGLGVLFRGDNRRSEMEEVLIFITPEILPYRPAQVRRQAPAGLEVAPLVDRGS
jgi:type IV pilus assembly protein PilQ